MSIGSVLVVEDDAALREALCDTLKMAGYTTLSAVDGKSAIDMLDQTKVQMVISDVQMKPMDGTALLKWIRKINPHLPVVLMTAYGTIQKAVEAMREGAADYLVKPFEAQVLLNMVSRFITEVPPEGDLDPVAEDGESRDLLRLACRVAQSDATVLISGESGVGKEVYARYIHKHSLRRRGPFVAINCAAIPENMLEALLFGYEKGAFTGAYQANAGKFEQANGGTLLLDEISEMDLSLQAKLLRVLQEREVERLGSKKLIPLDVRVLATTNCNLREEVNGGRFREDLYYRLNVFPLGLLPLRERQTDILPLARRIIERESHGKRPPVLSPEAADKIVRYRWPGNVRELSNVIQRALILKESDSIRSEDLFFEAGDNMPTALSIELDQLATLSSAETESDEPPENNLRGREMQTILEVLREERGSRKHTAERLGISPRTLRYKLARMRDSGIAVPE